MSMEVSYYALSGRNLIEDMDTSFFFKSKNLILDIYTTYIAPLIPLLDKALKASVPIEKRIEQEEPPKLLDNLQRYAKMRTLRVHLTNNAMTTQQTRDLQLL